MSFIEEVEVAAASPPTAIAADGFSRVFYRSAPNQPLQPVGTRAYIKLVFDNIGRATP